MVSTEVDVLRRSARKSRLKRIKNEQIKEIMGLKEKPDIIDIIERKTPQRQTQTALGRWNGGRYSEARM